MAEKTGKSEALVQIGKLFEQKRKALGSRYKSREQFIDHRSQELFGAEEWISLRHLCNIEAGKNWVSMEKFIMLADALEMDPVDLFREVLQIYHNSQK